MAEKFYRLSEASVMSGVPARILCTYCNKYLTEGTEHRVDGVLPQGYWVITKKALKEAKARWMKTRKSKSAKKDKS